MWNIAGLVCPFKDMSSVVLLPHSPYITARLVRRPLGNQRESGKGWSGGFNWKAPVLNTFKAVRGLKCHRTVKSFLGANLWEEIRQRRGYRGLYTYHISYYMLPEMCATWLNPLESSSQVFARSMSCRILQKSPVMSEMWGAAIGSVKCKVLALRDSSCREGGRK